MLTSNDIYRAIKKRLKQVFPQEELQIKDIKNLDPPCLYIQYVNSEDNEVANDTMRCSCLFTVVYFSDSNTLLNLVQIENKIKTAFKKAIEITYTNGADKTVSRFLTPSVTSDPDENDEYTLVISLSFNFLQDAEKFNEFESDEYGNDNIIEVLELKRKE